MFLQSTAHFALLVVQVLKPILIVTHQFKDVNAAKTFADSEELKSAMAELGVSGPPEFWFAEDIEQTPY